MGIDGIGGGAKPPGGISGPKPIERPSSDFSVERASETQGPSELQKLNEGELSLEQYLDNRVQEAASHLEGTLPVEQLDLVKDQLKEQLRTDAVLGRLVQRATGVVPSDNDG